MEEGGQDDTALDRWFGSVLSVSVVASVLFAYSQYRQYLIHKSNPEAVEAKNPQIQIPVQMPDDIGVARGREFTLEFWIAYATKMLWIQVKIVCPIAAYMIIFKDFVLGLERTPNFHLALAGVGAVVVGLGLFLEGLKFGVMPVGEALGKVLPVRAPLPVTLFIALLLGVGVTFAEPAIGALQTVGKVSGLPVNTVSVSDLLYVCMRLKHKDVDVVKCPYLFELLNGWSFPLVTAVGAGVGVASVIGVLRFMNGWSLKPLIYASLGVTLSLTIMVYLFTPSSMAGVIGLAWDCGAVTTGPVTVPLVIALGVGVSATSTKEVSPFASFGLVTLASLLPVVSVLMLALWLLMSKSPDEIIDGVKAAREGNAAALERGDGDIDFAWLDDSPWREVVAGARALGPLIAFLYVVLKYGLREELPLVRASFRRRDGAEQVKIISVYPGLIASFLGIVVFNLGLNHGLSRLGNEGGSALPAAFMPLDSVTGSPLFTYKIGFPIVLLFTFFLGIGATMAEPALAALGMTVQRLTEGKFDPRVLAGAVPVGVATGLVLGIFLVLYSIPIVNFIVIMYPIAALITWGSTEEFVNIAWDSAGVTTGPVTVPLVLSLGSGFSVATHSKNGFGLLTLASICPILSVLIFGSIVNKKGGRSKYTDRKMLIRQQSGKRRSDSVDGVPSALDPDDEDFLEQARRAHTPEEFENWSREADQDFGVPPMALSPASGRHNVERAHSRRIQDSS